MVSKWRSELTNQDEDVMEFAIRSAGEVDYQFFIVSGMDMIHARLRKGQLNRILILSSLACVQRASVCMCGCGRTQTYRNGVKAKLKNSTCLVQIRTEYAIIKQYVWFCPHFIR